MVDSASVSDSTTNGSCDGDCTPPTLGVDKNNKRLVSDGFSFNGNPVDVRQYYTPYPLITANVGVENITVLKIYDNGGPHNIEHVGLSFGLGKGETFNDSKAAIELDITHDGQETVSVFDPEKVLDGIRVETENDSCGHLTSAQCLIVTMYHTFREPLNFNMVGTMVWDFDRNSWQNYYNHGIHIAGESMNPPKTSQVAFGTKDMRGLYELTRIDKFKDLWQDEFGSIYQHMGNDRYDKVYSEPKPFIRDPLTSHGCNRHCNWFGEYVLEQEEIAKDRLIEILNGKIIEGEPPEEPFTIYFHFVAREDDPILQQNIRDEADRAHDTYMKVYPKKPVNNFED